MIKTLINRIKEMKRRRALKKLYEECFAAISEKVDYVNKMPELKGGLTNEELAILGEMINLKFKEEYINKGKFEGEDWKKLAASNMKMNKKQQKKILDEVEKVEDVQIYEVKNNKKTKKGKNKNTRTRE